MSSERFVQRLGTTAERDHIVATVELRTQEGEQLTIHHDTVTDPVTLAITGEQFEYRHRDPHSAGQIVDQLGDITTPASGWTLDEIRELRELWDRWHLNTMRAACAHMVEAELVREDGFGGTRISTSAPENTCPVSGYRYGHAWLTEVLPDDVIKRVRHLMRDRSRAVIEQID